MTGLILLGPISDIAGEAKRIGRRELGRRVARASRLAARDRRALVPSAWGFWSARRYLSLYRPGGAEDVFPYYRPGARWTALRAIRAPLVVMVGGRDEFLDRSPEALIEAFAAQAARAESFTGRIIPGALHGFQGREAAVAQAVVDWSRARRLQDASRRAGDGTLRSGELKEADMLIIDAGETGMETRKETDSMGAVGWRGSLLGAQTERSLTTSRSGASASPAR